jgi:flagellin
MSDNAARHLNDSYNALSTSVERLSSGLRINSAKDDAAGMAVSNLLGADITTQQQAQRNAQDGNSMLQTADGALGVVNNLLDNMDQLAEQAATGSYSSAQRTVMNQEYNQDATEITNITNSTSFNGVNLLNGSMDTTSGGTGVTFQLGATSQDTIHFATQNMDAAHIANGQSVTSTSATAADATANQRVVASADDNYVTAGDISGTTNNLTIGYGGNTMTLTLTGATSLNSLVQQINTQAQTATGSGGLGTSGPIAFATFDSTYQGYRLELKGTTTGAGNNFTIGTDAGGTNNLAIFGSNADLNQTNSSAAGANDLTTTTGAQNALATVSSAIAYQDTYRAQLGAYMNQLSSASSVLGIQAENLTAAQSSIEDVDVATEMATMTQNQVLAQAGVSMLAQANSIPQMALKLLG